MKKKIIMLFAAIFVLFGIVALSSNAGAQFRLGDVDASGKISITDARIALRVAAGINPPLPSVSHWAADIDKDNRITISDARKILRSAVEIELLPEEYYDNSIIEGENTTLILIDMLDPAPVETVPSQESTTSSKPGSSWNGATGSYPKGDEVFPIPAMPEYSKEPGTFAFISYGWGHGVGMSQYGTVYLAEQCGCDYRSILGYYYRGVGLAVETPPESVRMDDGVTYVDTVEILARITQQEIGGITYNREALKAQVVAAYTNIVEAGYKVKNLAYTPNMSRVREDVIQAVYDVYGEYLVYNGRVISAVFGAMSAGVTADPYYIWGGDYSYLKPVSSPFDRLSNKYLTVKTYTVEEIREIIEQFNKKVRSGSISFCGEIDLSGDPSTWFTILSHDGAVSNEVGYVVSMKIGDQIIANRAGQRLRESIFSYDIRSHCLIIEYYP